MFSKINNYIKLIIASIFYAYLTVFQRHPKRLLIYYHGIRDCDVESFARQMAYLSEFCEVVRPSEIISSDFDPEKTLIGITFDDAFSSAMDLAVPILREHELPAGFYVPTGNLGNAPSWEVSNEAAGNNERIITAEQVRELNGYGFEIGSHTVSHPKLPNLDDRQLTSELTDSKSELEDIVGHEILTISYPNGKHDNRVCEFAKACGYRIGFIIEPYLITDETDELKIGRFGVLPQDSLYEFKLKISGAYQVVKVLRAFRRFVMRHK